LVWVLPLLVTKVTLKYVFMGTFYSVVSRGLCDMQGVFRRRASQMAQPSRMLRRLDKEFVT
jgi:hypothetical protein